MLLRKLLDELSYDEAWTVNRYASSSFGEIATTYTDPNNHIGFSLLLRLFWLVDDGMVVLRLPSFIVSLLTLCIVFRLTHRVSNSIAASVSATAWLGLNQVYVNYAVQVRGYSLSMLLGVVILWLSVNACESSGRSRGLLILRSVLIVWFLYVLPTNLLTLASIAVLIGGTIIANKSLSPLARNRLLMSESGIHVAGVLSAIVLYLPVAADLMSRKGEFVFHQSSVLRAGADLLTSSFHDSWILPVAVVVILIAGRGRLPADWKRILLAVIAVILIPFALSIFLRIAPFSRNYLPLLPILAVPCGVMIGMAVEIVIAQFEKSKGPARAPAICLAIVVAVTLPRIVTFPDRLSERRKSGGEETLYYVFTAARFDPSLVVEQVGEMRIHTNYYLCLMTERAWQSLAHSFGEFQIPTVYVKPASDKTVRAEILVISLQPPDLVELSETSNIPIAILQQLKPPEDVGGFLVMRTGNLVTLDREVVEQVTTPRKAKAIE